MDEHGDDVIRPEELFSAGGRGGGQIGIHRKIHTGKLDLPPLPD